MRFDEVWMSRTQLMMLCRLARKTNGLPGEVIEIGVWQGLSAVNVMNAIAPAKLHVVDHWLGDAVEDGKPGISPRWAAERDNYRIFLDNVAEGTKGNVIVHKMGWRDFAKDWDQPIRFLHIDATHSTREVSDNIAVLLPFAVPGAVFAGDDYNLPEVADGVHQQFDTVHTLPGEKIWWKIID